MLYRVYRLEFGVWTIRGTALNADTARSQANACKSTNPKHRYAYDDENGELTEV